MITSPITPQPAPPQVPLPGSNSPLNNDHIRDLMGQCIHCGLCLPACPTYSIFHTEMDSPRGRIALINAAADGRIDLDGPFQEHIELCLGCRACETACPSGVQYGLLYEAARTAIEEARTPSRMERSARWLGLRQLMPHKGRLRLLARTMKLYQVTGLQRVVRTLNVLPKGLQNMEALLPPLPDSYPDYSQPAPAIGEKRGEVAFLYGCVQDAFLTGVNAASVRVLQRNGYEVHFPQAQTCCGAAQLHSGEQALTQELARRNIDACRGRDYVAIISNAGGCGATLKQYAHLLADDPLYGPWAQAFVAKVQDISEFLADHLHNPPTGHVEARVAYVESCHLRHGQKIVKQPRQLLKAIPGVEFIELNQPDMCCGSAGIYNIVQPTTANEVLDAKLVDVAQTQATTIVTTNTGCQMQMIYGVRKANLSAEVIHLVELLDRAYFKADAS